MKTSDSISKIAPALLKAQKAITFAVKDSKNPQFKSMYADLSSVIEACKPALNDAGIVFVQMAEPCDAGMLALSTRLIHESGEWIEATATCATSKSDAQGFGSATTYLRRYSLAAAVGLYQDDDDGNAASAHRPAEDPRRTAFLADTKAAIEGASNAGELKKIVAETLGKATSLNDIDAANQINAWAEAKAAKAKRPAAQAA